MQQKVSIYEPYQLLMLGQLFLTRKAILLEFISVLVVGDKECWYSFHSPFPYGKGALFLIAFQYTFILLGGERHYDLFLPNKMSNSLPTQWGVRSFELITAIIIFNYCLSSLLSGFPLSQIYPQLWDTFSFFHLWKRPSLLSMRRC